MSKRKYEQVQQLLPEIRAMSAAGKTQRDIAEHFGFSDKFVVKRLLKRERDKDAKLRAGIVHAPKAVHARMRRQEMLLLNRHTRSIA